ncbi:Zinc finger, RING-type [Corchorus capsularis]|uniref:RING-type E3 ubiquitin transferase n=1 Tax=Corchorus capsularis TaxID=210143 RepID=A0A1R3KMN2_COCAP|nr:Zinc finger, RING-type [Corchorus capsularis]
MSDHEASCDVWAMGFQAEDDESVPNPVFQIAITARLTLALEEEDDEEEPFFIHPESVVVEKTEQVGVDQLLDENNGRDSVREILLSMGVPVQDFMVERILGCAHNMATDKCYMNQKVLKMGVQIDAIVAGILEEEDEDEEDEDDDDEEEEEDGDDDESSLSEKGAMVDLTNKVVIEKPNVGCPICLEDFVVGTEAVVMRCSHRFHHDCIIPWIAMKTHCPVCRSELTG